MTPTYKRPEILDRIPWDRHAVIEASAGTGKTYTIEHMVIELLLRENASLGEILVLTFTERAASELRKRLRAIIGKILAADGDADPNVTNVWRVDSAARERLTRALFAFDASSIGTIHGFFGGVLSEYAFENGRLFEGTLEDGHTLFDRAFKDALRRELARRPGDHAELLEAWLERGSGGVDGLEDLLYRCHASRREIRPPFSIEDLRREVGSNPLFAMNLAANSEAFAAALKAAKVHHSTVKSIKERLLPNLAAVIARSGRTIGAALDPDAQEAIRKIAAQVRARGLSGDIGTAVMALGDHIVPLKAAIIQAFLPRVLAALERQKGATGRYDFDDVIAGVAGAVAGPGGEGIVKALRSRYRFALIDEFQDTDELQWSFFRRVFLESEGKNLAYLIGDPKQAIYGFRGADVSTYLAARAEVESSGVPPVPLTRNFRSTPALIDAYNHVLDQGSESPFFDGPIRYDAPVEGGRTLFAEETDGSRYAPIHLLEIQPWGESLGLAELRRGLARQIAREARDLISGAHGLKFGDDAGANPVPAGEIYVLAATNQDSLRVAQALREAGVPFAFYKQDGLFQSPEARSVRDLLAAIDDPSDRSKRGKAWISPFFAVPLSALPDLDELADSHPLLARLVDWKDLADSRRFERLFSRILDDSGVIRRELFLKDHERGLTNYQHLFEILLEDARATGAELGDLIKTLDAYILGIRKPPGEDGNVQRLESDRDAVQIMSIHKSKGLEAAVVFLYGGFTGFRSDGFHEYHDEAGRRILSIGDDEAAKDLAGRERQEELQRLYYVAMTRAKARLYLPLVPRPHWNGHWTGGYKRVNERLLAVVDGLEGSGKADRFRRVPFRDAPIRPWVGLGPDEPLRDLAAWHPPRALLDDRQESAPQAALRTRHSGYAIASYSQMKHTWDDAIDPLGRDDLRREPERPTAASLDVEGDLPGGTASGTFLHEILELIPLGSLKGTPPLDAWRALDDVSSVVAEALDRNGISAEYRAIAEAMVYHALTAEVVVGPGRSIPGLGTCSHALREMEFLFPYPEEGHPPLSEPVPGKLVVERGFIKGFVDLVVEHEGLVYFADWKSDVLPSYGPREIEAHVQAHYALQAKLYAMALVKALRIHSASEYNARFGGLVYAFLRGLRSGAGQGVGLHFARPRWEDILRDEDEVRRFGARAADRGGE